MNTDADKLDFEPAMSKIGKPNESAQLSAQADYKNCCLSLLYKGINVHVRNIRLGKDGALIGDVFEFTNICSTAYEGVRLGQSISFRDYHVHQRIDG
ncbi:MAG: hypothetical protein OQK12_10670 [Motiliproteus sp.]|nr:hypothetical protein [Motiliproteus sp.]MCW9054239.1 hypothetical protein [Motiliproteus sp.]